jgi:hypothetical protein
MSQLPNNSASFPPALPTPDSFGQTFHKHNYETDGITTHLNVNNDNAGVWTGGIGGFQFSTINSTLTTPIELLNINDNGLTIDKSTSGTPPVYSPNVFALHPDNTTILFPSGTDLNLPPYNMTQTFNPIYMTQTTALYTTGDLCYAVKGSNDSIIIFNNDNTANPIPPNVVPTGFPTGSNVGVTVGIPIFTLTLPSPSTIQTATLNNSLTIINDTTQMTLDSTSLRGTLNRTALVLEAPNNGLFVSNTAGDLRASIIPTTIEIQDFNQNLRTGMTIDRIFIFNQNINTNTNVYPGLVQQGNSSDVSNLSITELQINDRAGVDISTLNKSSLNITNSTNSNTSILTSNDLTFNNVSLKSQVSTNTTNIATNTSNISTNTTNIQKNTQAISKLQYANPINIANSPTIYGALPSSPPMIPTTNAINSGFNGWYYRNISSAYNNISWSVGFQPSNYVVSNLKGIYFTFVSLTTTSKPFFSVYTLPAQAPGGFYNSRRSFVPAIAPATITAGIPYIYYYMFDNAYPTPFKYCHQAVPLTLSAVNPVGAFGANELLYFASINTNSISAVNTEELIIAEAGVIIDDGTGTLIQPFSFNGASVFSPNSYRAVQQGAGTITPTISNNGTTYIATANFTISNAGLSGVPAGFFIIVQGTTVDRTITYNTSATKTVHTNTGTTNASQVIFYWLGDTFVAYN